MALTADEAAALRSSVRASVEKFADADRVAQDIGAADLLEDALPALSIFFEEFGRFGLSNALVDDLVGHALGLDAAKGPAFVHPAPHRARSSAHSAIEQSDGLVVDGLLRRPTGDAPAEVVTLTDVGIMYVLPTGDLTVAAAPGFDPSGGWLSVRGTVPTDRLGSGRSGVASRAVALARLGLGSELTGIAAKINAIAIEHVTSRRQFGKALGSFQTVRHRLAEAHVAIQAAQSVLTVGWSLVESSDGELDLDTYAKASKALAGKAVETATRHANQVCGGMGLTLEHPLPPLVRRGAALNAVLGSPVDLAADIGRALSDGASLAVPDPFGADDVPAMAP